MWLIVPLIFIMSWRFCRNFGQAVSETAAWIAGYLVTAGIIILLNIGSTNLMMADRPDSPAALVALLGGFVGMYISHRLWKRRGGHLNQKPNRWLQGLSRGLQAARTAPKATSGTRPRAASTTRPSAPVATKATAGTAAAAKPSPASPNGTTAKRPAPRPRSGGTVESVARDLGKNPNVRKAMSNRWVRGSMRALDAMMTDPKAKKKTPRK